MIGREPGSALPEFETGFNRDQIPDWVDVIPAGGIIGKRLDIQIVDREGLFAGPNIIWKLV